MSELLDGKRLGDLLAAARPDGRAYVLGDRTLTFGEVDRQSDAFAAALLALGYRRGDRLAINAPNLPEWIVAWFGAAKIGVCTVGLSVRYRDVEHDYIINQSGARGVVTLSRWATLDYAAYFAALRERLPGVRDYFFIGPASEAAAGLPAAHDLARLCAAPVEGEAARALSAARAEVTPDDLAMLIYTSGTLGKPKGAMLTHRSQIAAARAQAAHTRVSSDDTILLVMPLNHVGGITCGVLAMLLGQAAAVLLPAFDVPAVLAAWKAHSPTVWAGVPTMHTLLAQHGGDGKLDGSGVRLVITGGSNADPSLLRRVRELFPSARIMNLYGLSESSGAAVMSGWDDDFEATVHAIGRPLPGLEARVVDEHAKEVRAGAIGELQLRGESIVGGYFGMPGLSAEAFSADGWLRTGDLGYVDEAGRVVLMGRLKEMYIQGGFNVYPVEVENLIARHPAVALVAGIGVPDPVLGEVGRYYVVPRPGQTVEPEAILAFCAEHLADYKVPRQLVVRAELPLTPAGKIMKSRLREEQGL